MGDVILTKDGKRFAFPADKAADAMAAGFAAEASPAAPQPSSRRGRGSGGGIDAGPSPAAPPAGESDAADVILEKGGKKFAFPAAKAAEARAAGFSEPSRGALDTIKAVGGAVVDAVTGRKQQTAETESLPDFNLMPEMRQALISNTIPVGGSLTAPLVVAGESLARNVSPDARGFGLPAAFENMKANARTSLGTTLASAPEQVKALVVNNPGVKTRKDEKGNVILTSAQDGKDYIVPPGASVFDAPRAAQTLAAGVPMVTAGPAMVAGRTLGPIASKALAGAVGQGLTEVAQTVGGGSFDAENIPIAAGANAIGPALGAAKTALGSAAERSAAELAASNAARRATQVEVNAAAGAPATTPAKSAGDVLGNLVDAHDSLDPVKQAALEELIPGFGRIFRVAKAKVKHDRAKDAVKAAAKEADDVVKAVDDEVAGNAGKKASEATGSATATDPFEAARVRGDAVEAARSREPSGANALDRTLTPSPMPGTNPGRGPRTPPAPPPPTPAPLPEPTATAPVPRLPPMTEGLEPTEVLSREVPKAARPRNLDDDAAAALVRETAIAEGTRDLATLASKSGLSTAQTQRVLERLVKSFKFRNEVDEAAARKAAPAARVPAGDLLEGIAAGQTGGKVTPVTLRQEAAIQREAAQAVTLGDFANRLRDLPTEGKGLTRGEFLRALKKDKGVEFANKVAKMAGISTKGI